ncbi:transposase [Microseira sp. BLCC-F43]|uniref:transposase n=1 Tax=Microseira sp. BLCC-F43 TaxID=3153602 RepID=UPI0035B737C9
MANVMDVHSEITRSRKLERSRSVSKGLGRVESSPYRQVYVPKLSDAEWMHTLGFLPGRVGARARNGGDARNFLDSVLWVAQTRALWSDLPQEFGPPHRMYVRFIRWSVDGTWFFVLSSFSPRDERHVRLFELVEGYLSRKRR